MPVSNILHLTLKSYRIWGVLHLDKILTPPESLDVQLKANAPDHFKILL